MLTFTSLGPKSYFCEIGEVVTGGDVDEKSAFKTKVTGIIAPSKGFTLSHQSTKGLITKNIMREFLEAVGIYVPYGWKVSALRAEKSKANFSFREANFSFRDRTVGAAL